MAPKIVRVARRAMTPDLAVIGGGSLASVGVGMLSLAAGLIVGGIWIAVLGVVAEVEEQRKKRARP